MTSPSKPAEYSNVVDLVAAMAARGWEDTEMKPVPSQRRPPHTPAMFRVHIELVDTPVWRVVDMQSELTLDVVHDLVQVTMGWTNSHLHMFTKGPSAHHPSSERYVMPDPEGDDDLPGVPEAEVRLGEVLSYPGDTLFYEYDFGDSWDHVLILEETFELTDNEPTGICIDGAKACPPEDCGGIPGYERLVEVIKDPTAPDADQLLSWAGDWDPDLFDVHAVNRNLQSWSALPNGLMTLADPGYGFPARVAALLRRVRWYLGDELRELALEADLSAESAVPEDVAQSMVRPYQWLLTRVGTDGLQLTGAGYMKPEDVLACATELEMEDEWIGKFNRESQTLPVLVFRESAQQLGLVRKFKGRLVRTASGKKVDGNSMALCHFIAAKLPVGRDFEKDAGTIALLMVAAGKNPQREPIESYLSALGWGYQDGTPMDSRDAYDAARPTIEVLQRLEVIPQGRFGPNRDRSREPLISRAFARASLNAP